MSVSSSEIPVWALRLTSGNTVSVLQDFSFVWDV